MPSKPPQRSASDASDDEYPPLPDGTPTPVRRSQIEQITDDEIEQILVYNPQSDHGGHQSGQGIAGKTEFPPGWGVPEVRHAIDEVLDRPTPKQAKTPRHVELWRVIDGVLVVVIVQPPYARGNWFITTAYPHSGADVVYNPAGGGREPRPLDLSALENSRKR